jgi:DNA-binding IclR family transcriptional regulator
MDTRVADQGQDYHKKVPSVDRALDLLELLASANTGMSLAVISRRLNIPKSSAYYLVTSLARRNCVWRSPDRRVYSLGTDAPGFLKAGDAEAELKTLCAPHLEALSKSLGMPAQIGMREGGEVRIIARTPMPGLKLDSWVGRHFDLHCTALGKALISNLADAELEKLLKIRGLAKHNQNTMCSMALLKSQLADIRRCGFATDDEEHELGVRCVASPLFNSLGGIIAAIGVFASSEQLLRSQMSEVGLKLRAVAKETCRSLHGNFVAR